MKKITVLFLTIVVLISSFAFSASAASNATISFSKNTVSVGDSVTVSITVNPGKTMNAVQYVINYNETVLQFVSSDQMTGGAGVLQVVESFGDKTSVTYSGVFTAIATGECAVSVSDCLWSAGGTSEVSFGGASAKVTVKDAALSNNANLKSLSLNTGSLSPKFSASRTSYTAKVAYETTKVNVSATASDSGAKVVSISGNTDLKVGSNTVTVTVQAADGSQKKYTIVVTRLKEGESLTDDTASEPETPEVNPLETTISGTPYTVAAEIPEQYVLNGFTVSTTSYNGTDISVLSDDNYTIYYLKSAESEDLVPYTYNKELEVFEKLKYMSFGKSTYIFEEIPDEYAVPENMYLSNLKISDFLVECLSSNGTDSQDFHYVYCYTNGSCAVYRYDSLEETLQRYPELTLVTLEDAAEKDTFLARVNSLSTNAKVILACLCIAVLGALALLVFFIIFIVKKIANRNVNIEFEEMVDDFDEVAEEDTAEISEPKE